MAFKMNGFPAHKGTSMNKQTSDAGKNLLKVVPNEEAYNKLSDIDKTGFDKAAKKAGLPTKTTIAKQKVVKEGEGQDENKIFDEKGNHVGNYVNGKKVMLKPGFKRPAVKKDTPKNFSEIKQKPLHTGYEEMVDPAFQTNRGKAKPSTPVKQKMKKIIPPKQLETLPFEGMKPDYPTFEEKNHGSPDLMGGKKIVEPIEIIRPKKITASKSMAKQKDFLDATEQQQRIEGSRVDLKEKKYLSDLKMGKLKHKNRSRIIDVSGAS